MKKRFSIKQRLRSFPFAFNGLKILLREEHNARIHLVAAILAIIAGFGFKISSMEWLAVIFAIGLVFALELVNSALENLADFLHPDKHESIKKVKDLAAAAVLVAAMCALVVGLLIFVPKLASWF